jgi:hypothetical protein
VVGVVAPPAVAGGEVPLAGILLSAGLVIGVAVLTLREIRRE